VIFYNFDDLEAHFKLQKNFIEISPCMYIHKITITIHENGRGGGAKNVFCDAFPVEIYT